MLNDSTSTPKVPDILYKYRNFQDNHLSILKNKQIYFANVDSFNDPFDCRIPIRYDLLSEKEFDTQQIHRLFELSNNPIVNTDPRSRLIPPNLSHEDAVLFYFTKAKGHEGFAQYSGRKDMTEFQLNHLRDTITVFCLSEENDNVLLWSHYSDNHAGFCIGFDKDSLNRDTKAGFGRIEYTDYPTFKPNNHREELRVAQVLSKAETWRYEKEWRFVHWDKQSTFSINPDCIKEVILGCSVSVANKNAMVGLIKNDPSLSHVKLLIAEIVPYTFTLRIKTL